MEEIFKDIPGYEGMYQVSNLGRIKSFKWEKEKILKQGKTKFGYPQICLTIKLKKTYPIHKLVAIVFLNNKTDGTQKIVIDHINNNKLDNRLENLQLISQRENSSKDRKNKTSKYTGVCWDKNRNKWISSIYINGKRIRGRYNTELEAYEAYKINLKQI
jgi:hypothetical protein